MKTKDTQTVEVCVYGEGRFLEFIYGGRFVVVELKLLPSDIFEIKSVSVKTLGPGGSCQTFGRVKHFPTEKRLRLPVSIANKIITLKKVYTDFGSDRTRFSTSRHPFDELNRVVREDLHVFLKQSSSLV